MILIVDFGSQYSQLIARRIRSKEVLAVLCSPDPEEVAERIKEYQPQALILSGGPANVYDAESPKCPDIVWDFQGPILGICYGMQLIAHHFNGKVQTAEKGEYGFSELEIFDDDLLFKECPPSSTVWMSHKDSVTEPPLDFSVIARTPSCIAGIRANNRPIWGIQFHPEVKHSEHGMQMIENFIFKAANAQRNWSMKNFINREIEEIRQRVGDKKVVCAVSGGVDSTVMACLLYKALGDQLTCMFVNNGVLRKDEELNVQERFRNILKIPLIYLDEEELFLDRLKDIDDPEEKRKVIGKSFIDVFYKKVNDFDFLAQGTLYPDVIESVNFKGPSQTIKTHHNRVPEVMELIRQGRIIEPLRELFKDEVRLLGKELGIDHDMLWRHPFPGPGLAIRILGDVSKERLDILRLADAILIDELRKTGWYAKIWQAFAVLLPVKSVGVMGDCRTYEYTCALRMVESTDGMTADWVKLPYDILGRISTRIVNEVQGINRVVYDVSSKPPATIEWE